MHQPTCGLSRLWLHPVLSQSLKLLKLPTAKHSPLGAQATDVMTWAFKGLTKSCRPNASHTFGVSE